ncbi:MAG: hypothetical protein ACK5II_01930 [Paracoccus sp. (in: a-proteobacteria)]
MTITVATDMDSVVFYIFEHPAAKVFETTAGGLITSQDILELKSMGLGSVALT